MKTVTLALLILLVVTQGEALRCYCGGRYRRCSGRIETCRGRNPVCISAAIHAGLYGSSFRGCYDADGCRTLQIYSQVITATCCSTDLCNWRVFIP